MSSLFPKYIVSPRRDKFIEDYYAEMARRFKQEKIDKIPMMSPEDKGKLKSAISERRGGFIAERHRSRIDKHPTDLYPPGNGEIKVTRVTAYRGSKGYFVKKDSPDAREIHYLLGYDKVAKKNISLKK